MYLYIYILIPLLYIAFNLLTTDVFPDKRYIPSVSIPFLTISLIHSSTTLGIFEPSFWTCSSNVPPNIK